MFINILFFIMNNLSQKKQIKNIIKAIAEVLNQVFQENFELMNICFKDDASNIHN